MVLPIQESNAHIIDGSQPYALQQIIHRGFEEKRPKGGVEENRQRDARVENDKPVFSKLKEKDKPTYIPLPLW